MILTGKEDPRVQKTIESIKEAFHDLILEKDYEKITVKELCERARINKKTFYTYYETLDDLLLETQSSIAAEYQNRIKGLSLKDMNQLVREFFLFSEEQGPFYEKITCGGSYAGIRQKMIEKVMSGSDTYAELRNVPEYEKEIIKTFTADSLLGSYRQWIASGKKLSVERIISLTAELITGGIRNYMHS
ncbi:TetR/AcrR family transcriptional regulator [Catenisphaera adipataccumulans]|uniref:AcrR family transcriptional regulator n=1 Tax=Catenisphaera adipataccumulans TaxID=700500 RepID=A0A7W8CX89_9FIRM|nr:TetR/AcrR family transcriptional regulator C-terminal domain-containing protein [Catenisphaera adipataccumulans]MBB5182624.1 AcrR family transcriptional regulator [Catenisphaera adipataccumulans]